MLSQTAQYGLRAVVFIAQQPSGQPVTAAPLARALGIPQNYLGKTLQQLAHAGILRSTRGKAGGFQLGRDPYAISLLDVVAPFEGMDERPVCLLGGNECSSSTPCPMHSRWSPVAREIDRFFRSTSLGEVAEGPPPSSWTRAFRSNASSSGGARGAGGAARPAPAMLAIASGTFDVQVTPADPTAPPTAVPGRMHLVKQFHGDLVGTSEGQMLAAMTETKGSAGYVAIEKVTGSLHGRAGAFVLQHTGTMSRGAQQLTVTVVPDSGTGALAGIAGSLRIEIEGKVHRYTFEYALPQ
ncbi:MAG: Rrf2 family transcriptional regulator [Gemmatimonadetes bacterium]|nr:Rrf2 family transcriptional regulator [Gemmatimonadota bacterium]